MPGLVGWLLCLLRLHVQPAGLNPQMSLYWHCDRCGTRVPGALTKGKR